MLRWPTPSLHHRWNDASDCWVCSWFPPITSTTTASPTGSVATTSNRTSPSEEKRDGAWVDCGLDQAVKDVNFAEFKRLGLLIKKVMDADQWLP